MPAPLRVVLTPDEDQMLSQLRKDISAPQRTRARAHMIRFNAQGWNVPAMAEIFECHEHTARATLRRWQRDGISGLWESPGHRLMFNVSHFILQISTAATVIFC